MKKLLLIMFLMTFIFIFAENKEEINVLSTSDAAIFIPEEKKLEDIFPKFPREKEIDIKKMGFENALSLSQEGELYIVNEALKKGWNICDRGIYLDGGSMGYTFTKLLNNKIYFVNLFILRKMLVIDETNGGYKNLDERRWGSISCSFIEKDINKIEMEIPILDKIVKYEESKDGLKIELEAPTYDYLNLIGSLEIFGWERVDYPEKYTGNFGGSSFFLKKGDKLTKLFIKNNGYAYMIYTNKKSISLFGTSPDKIDFSKAYFENRGFNKKTLELLEKKYLVDIKVENISMKELLLTLSKNANYNIIPLKTNISELLVTLNIPKGKSLGEVIYILLKKYKVNAMLGKNENEIDIVN